MGESYSGNLIIVSAPSGGGKTSLVRKLLSSLENIEVSISHTTRKIRPAEEDGVDYFFISEKQFREMIDEGAFVEYATVFNHFYGTSVAQIKERLMSGIDVLLDIDWQGAKRIKELFVDAISVFIVPPSLKILKQRLLDRRQDNEEVIGNRMKQAQDEMSHFSEFDYLIVNDDFSKAFLELQAIVIADRLRTKRQKIKQRKLLSFLLTSG